MAKATGVSLRQLYYWIKVLRVIEPQAHAHGQRNFAHFTEEDLRKVKTVSALMTKGYTLKAAVEIVKGDRSHE